MKERKRNESVNNRNNGVMTIVCHHHVYGEGARAALAVCIIGT